MTGHSKHRKSGKTTKSPNLRHRLALDAAKNDRKSRRAKCTAQTVAEALEES